MSNTMSIKGRAGSDASLRFTPNGRATADFSVADTPRKKDESGQWVDAGPTLWQRVQVWGPEAEKARVLDELRVARANSFYARNGLEPITAADLPRHAGNRPEAVTERPVRRESAPERLGDTKAFPFKRRSES